MAEWMKVYKGHLVKNSHRGYGILGISKNIKNIKFEIVSLLLWDYFLQPLNKRYSRIFALENKNKLLID